MALERIPTDKLLQKLFKTVSLNRFIQNYNLDNDGIPIFHEFISDLCKKKGMQPERIIKNSDIERTYGYQLFNGRRKPSRDKVIQLAFGFGMNFEEAQELLTIARKSVLYPRVKRDAVIIFALQRGYDIDTVQMTLSDLSVPILGEER